MRKSPIDPRTPAKISFRLIEAVEIEGAKIELFEANLSFFARAALANFAHGGRIPRSTRVLSAELESKCGVQRLVTLTAAEKHNYALYAKAHGNLPLGSLVCSAFCHALGVLQFPVSSYGLDTQRQTQPVVVEISRPVPIRAA